MIVVYPKNFVLDTGYTSYGTDFNVKNYKKIENTIVSGVESNTVFVTPGQYQAILQGNGNYSGEYIIEFTVYDTKDLSGYTVYTSKNYFLGQVSQIKEDFATGNNIYWVKDDTALSNEDTPKVNQDYTVSSKFLKQYSDEVVTDKTVNTTEDTYRILITATGTEYTGTNYCYVTVLAESYYYSVYNQENPSNVYWMGRSETLENDLQNGKFEIKKVTETADGSNETVLKYNTDFTLDYYVYNETEEITLDEASKIYTQAGQYYAAVKGIGAYENNLNIDIYFTVAKDTDLSYYIGYSSSSYYTGDIEKVKEDAKKWILRRYENGNAVSGSELTHGTDYKFAGFASESNGVYSDVDENTVNSSAGTYYAKYTGIGNYSGTAYIAFSMQDAKNLGSYSIGLGSYTYLTGKLDLIKENIKNCTWYKNSDGTKLSSSEAPVYGTDYDVVFAQIDWDTENQCYPTVDESVVNSTEGTYRIILKAKDGSSYAGSNEYNSITIRDKYNIKNYSAYWGEGGPGSARVYLANGTRTLETDIKEGEFHVALTIYSASYSSSEKTELSKDNYEIEKYLDSEGNSVDASSVYKTVGTYTAILKGIAPYTGEREVYITVKDPYDLSTYACSLYNYEYYNTQDELLEKDIKDGHINWYLGSSYSGERVSLTYGTDYEIDHYENLSSENVDLKTIFAQNGYGYAVLKGAGKYAGTSARVYFSVKDPKAFSALKYTWTNDNFYTYQNPSTLTDKLIWRDARGNLLDLTEGEDYVVEGYYLSSPGYPKVEGDDPLKEVFSKAGSYVMRLTGKTYEGTKEVCFSVNEIEEGKKVKAIQSVEVNDETFDVVAGSSAKSTANILVNGKAISDDESENIFAYGFWVEMDEFGSFPIDLSNIQAVETFEEGKTYAYYVCVGAVNTDTAVYTNELTLPVVNGITYDSNELADSYQRKQNTDSWTYCYGPYLIKECTKSSTLDGNDSSTSKPSKNNSSSTIAPNSSSSAPAAASAAPASAEEKKSSSTIVDTSDQSNMLYYAGISAIALIGGIIVVMIRKKYEA